MVCPQCRQELSEGAQFCVYCGTRSPSPTSVAGVQVPENLSNVPENVKSSENSRVDVVDPLIGRILDARYELVARIGEGGMGAVYRARRVVLGDEVAVKILHQKYVKDAAAIERFRREARAAALLHNPNIVAIHDFGETSDADARVFIVMELIDGEALRAVLQRELSLPTPRAAALMRDICAGVGAAHRRSIVHRDLKPDNIIVISHDAYHERETVKVVDFGIAKLRDASEAGSHTLTQTGMIMGTPYYMSPEQCRGEELDARADVYSLGAILYEMLAGRPPFVAPTMTGIVAKHLTEPPPPLPVREGVTSALDRVVQRALAKSPELRQADAVAFAAELKAAMDAPSSASHNAHGVIAPTILASEAQRPLPSVVTPQTIVSAPVLSSVGVVPPPVFTGTQPQVAVSTVQPPARRRTALYLFIFLLVAGLFGAVGVGALLLFSDNGLAWFTNNNNTAPRPRPTPATPVDLAAVRSEVTNAVNRWVETTRSRNIDTHMSSYAPRLDVYYSRRNVEAAQVRNDRTQAFTNYDVIEVEISNLRITPEASGNRATATFDKTWNFQGARQSSGSVQQRLTLENRDGRWLIIGERDLQLYYRNSQEPESSPQETEPNNNGDDDAPEASDAGGNGN